MGTKLRNRRAAEAQSGSFIEQLLISDELVTSILDNEVVREGTDNTISECVGMGKEGEGRGVSSSRLVSCHGHQPRLSGG